MLVSVVCVVAIAVAAVHPHSRLAPATLSWLQRRLDRGGGLIFLPRLPGGRCYQTRGLWVSRSHTTISSNGGCLTVVGPGPVRLRSGDGDPIAASAAFFIAHRTPSAPPPAGVTIRNLRIDVRMPGVDGVDVYADRVHISDVTVDGSPFDDVYIGGRTNVTAAAHDVTVAGATLLDADRNGISVTSAVGVQIRDDTIAGAGGSAGPAADPGDGIDVEPNAATDPIEGLQIKDNRIVGNVHQAIALHLQPGGRPDDNADRIAISGNLIVGNGPFGGGAQVSIGGGQRTRPTRILLARNRFSLGELALSIQPGHQHVTLYANTNLRLH